MISRTTTTTTHTLLLLLLTTMTITNAFTTPKLLSMSSSSKAPTEAKLASVITKKLQRRDIMKSPQFYRSGFKEQRSNVEELMQSQFKSSLVDELRANSNMIVRDHVTVYLAQDFGFCWGVERSIALAYEAVKQFPSKKVHITNELIHNPEVNDHLSDMNVNFIPKVGNDESDDLARKDFSVVEDGDVVILPAFGASLEEMQYFDEKNVEVVDTTCPWVSKVWNTVDTHQKNGLTSIIHGKYAHEETIATTSFCEDYIVVKDMKEAQYVCDYVLGKNEATKEELLKKFEKAVSANFDPDTMLTKVGIANQTTMYKKETRAIGQLLQKTMMEKFGPQNVNEHYMEFDTICDATQERQDAVSDLVEKSEELELDFILVVGGWDSSNTAHLLEIPMKAGVRSFHINRAECIQADNTITHRLMDGTIKTEKFLLNEGSDVKMGVTSGASTPDAGVDESLSQIFLLNKIMNASED